MLKMKCNTQKAVSYRLYFDKLYVNDMCKKEKVVQITKGAISNGQSEFGLELAGLV